jgi:single-strand DNA-binding protein
MYQNRVALIGFLGKDAEVRTTTNNRTPFTVLSLATKQSWKDRQTGDWLSDKTWHRCVVWGKLGEFAAALLKGAHIQIEGEIRTREYTPHGDDAKKSVTEVHVTLITKLDRPAEVGKSSPRVPPAAAVSKARGNHRGAVA